MAQFSFLRLSTIGQAVASVVFSCKLASLRRFSLPLFDVIEIVPTPPTCQSALTAEMSLLIVSVGSTSLLFFFRARAVFHGSRRATIFFLSLWTIIVGSCIAQSFFITAIKDSPGEDCRIERMQTACIVCFVSAAINDFLVFTLVSWKILTFFASEVGHKSRFADYLCSWDTLPKIAQLLLRTGQQYFL